MRIHSDILTDTDLEHAARLADVQFIKRTDHSSRKRTHAFEVALSGDASHRSQADREQYGATWDQWGIFLSALYTVDPTMVSGYYYADAQDFHFQTNNRFARPLALSERHRQHRWEHAGIYRTIQGDVTYFQCIGSKNFYCEAEMHRVMARRG